jgi:hypothetical protein
MAVTLPPPNTTAPHFLKATAHGIKMHPKQLHFEMGHLRLREIW